MENKLMNPAELPSDIRPSSVELRQEGNHNTQIANVENYHQYQFFMNPSPETPFMREAETDGADQHREAMAQILSDRKIIQRYLASMPRPRRIQKPETPRPEERPYCKAMLRAFEDYQKTNGKPRAEIREKADLPSRFQEEFEERRNHFYSAEAVRVQGEDTLGDFGQEQFAVLKKEIGASVYNPYVEDYENGLHRMRAVMSQAARTADAKSVFSRTGWVGSEERMGICHMLVNDRKMEWVRDDGNGAD